MPQVNNHLPNIKGQFSKHITKKNIKSDTYTNIINKYTNIRNRYTTKKNY